MQWTDGLCLRKGKYNVGQISSTQLTDVIFKNFFHGKLTYVCQTKGEEAMAPIVSPTGGAVLVRKLANLSPT
ncbi:Peptidase S24/S26A/S26B/S26C family protein [Zea mays]|nr:Peptidase S24/S26A/S26B/S26C family protein [Zea mays]